ncbi:Gfo/Idh/MocA family protein [Mediterraneibacter massiliensis]|uniref:Gfo/Idh/MocA family protein n=1 Tax=Mediterraneibacter massiliensis TaxID=1720300 RepID=UPI0022E183D1|nr:Gfo/Idh/MocA family oxidoreductase [Mediterraneibacter massiliensis]
MIRFATIGTNFIVDLFLEAAGQCSRLMHTAVYSRSRDTGEQFAKKHGVNTVYTDLTELAEAEEIDAVYIASPNFLHCEQAVLMLEHKKHVLCEKPICSNYKEFMRMKQAAQTNNAVLLEAMRPAYDPGIAAVKENLSKLGKIRRVTLRFCQYSSRYDKFNAGQIENAFRPELSNGALMDIGVYCVHPLLLLFGKPNRIQADAVFLENGVDGEGTILAGYPDMLAELSYSKITNGMAESEIQGEEGILIIDRLVDPKELRILCRKKEEERIQIDKSENNMIYEIERWCDLIEGKVPSEKALHISAMEMEMMDEVRRKLQIVFPADKDAESVWL